MKSEEQNTRRVAIVGGGIVSPLGFGLTETLQSLQQGRDCVTPVTHFFGGKNTVQDCRPD